MPDLFADSSVSIQHFFIFIIPGFITVWSFRYATNSKKDADFEYFALSAFWGIVGVSLNAALASREAFSRIMGNPYAAALAFSCLAFIVAFSWGKLLQKFRQNRSRI